MTPHPGQVVMVRAAPARNSGLTEAPAVVTRVQQDDEGGWLVNVRVLLDATDATPAKTDVRLYPDRAAADAAVPARTNTHVGWLLT